MITEIGHFSLLLCLPIALALVSLPLLGASCGQNLWMRLAGVLASAQAVFVAIAFACLSYAFLSDDFSVKLVAMHSQSDLPLRFKFSALWGNHEGSLLLWLCILSGWTVAVAWRARALPSDIYARVLAVLGMISVGFTAFIAFTSNPFERLLLNPPSDGGDLNPLLQDIGLILHPPILYTGYVGLSVAVSFAVSALLSGQFDSRWARWVRPWTNVAWSFLTVGIALGSWWAYYELGWGGWWFWDPVENASLMPWLAATALLHSLAASEKRGVFISWSILLAILAFSLSLLGTFLVRSGILVSVHAFASDPTRGLYILAFLSLVIGGSLLLYALKAPTGRSEVKFELKSREMLLLANNILLSIALAIVLLGTLFPLIMKALDIGSYSVGPPYFNSLFTPLGLALLLLMGLAPQLRWKRNSIDRRQLRPWSIALPLSLLISAIASGYLSHRYERDFSLLAAATVALSVWLCATMLLDFLGKYRRHDTLANNLKQYSASYWGMITAHLGVAVCALGIGLSAAYTEQRDFRMQIGDSVMLAGYRYQLQQINAVAGENYRAIRADIGVYSNSHNNRYLTLMQPEKRHYPSSKNRMTEAAIDPSLTRDLYISLGDKLPGQAWAVSIHIKPFIRCIWLGALLMALGATIAIGDRRYRLKNSTKSV